MIKKKKTRKTNKYPVCSKCKQILGSQGSVEVICGPMFSGKSSLLISRAREAFYAKQKVVAFTQKKDDRRGDDSINTFNKDQFIAVSVSNSKQILKNIPEGTSLVIIDEGNFFNMDLADVVNKIAEKGIRVIVAGLDRNFRGEGFGPMPRIKLEADKVTQLLARCAICGNEASRTQRLKIVKGKKIPARYSDPIVLVGEEEYEPRCRFHHEVPGKPKIKIKQKK
ncbi:thymidine kinase [Patescibacteria group bacterium]|nr:thymidine kinase [Patescibacteria group bacterium]MBU2036318.1 thymidine kinase [Patescibacteria group bacterium]